MNRNRDRLNVECMDRNQTTENRAMMLNAGGILEPREGTPLFGLYGDVSLDRVWFYGLAVLSRLKTCPKQAKNLS